MKMPPQYIGLEQARQVLAELGVELTRYFDRISRPEHILTALPRALRTLTDPADCGPVCLAFCQDVQAEAFDYPAAFFEPQVWRIRRPQPDPAEVADVIAAIRAAKNPVIVAGGGVLYSGAEDLLADFATRRNIPIVETQAGKGATAWEHPMNFGSPGTTGSACGNEACAAADLVIGVGTRFQDFTTGSWTVFANPDRKLVSINVHGYDALKHGAIGVVGDAKATLEKIDAALGDLRFAGANPTSRTDWHAAVTRVTGAPPTDANALPTDAQVIGAVQRVATENIVAMCAAGTMPGALQGAVAGGDGEGRLPHGIRLFLHGLRGRRRLGHQARGPVEGGGLLRRRRQLHDGELRTRHRRDAPRAVHRRSTTCTRTATSRRRPEIDFVAHAAAMGAHAEKAADVADLEAKIVAARGRDIPTVIVIDTDAVPGTDIGGHWWDVAVPQVGGPERLEKARERYHASAAFQRVFN